MNVERISQLQVVMLFIILLFTTSVAFLIGPLAESAGFGSWISLWAGSLIGLAIGYFAVKLGRKNPTEFFFHFGSQIVGKWIHLPLMALITFFFWHATAEILNDFQDFMSQNYLQGTPNWAINGLFALCLAIAVRSGIETIFRCAQGMLFLTVIIIMIEPIWGGKEMIPDMAIAFLTNHNWRDIVTTSYTVGPWFGEMFIVILFFPYIAKPEKTFRSLVIACFIATGFITVYLVSAILVFGPNVTAHLTYPVIELFRYIRIGDFLENLDPFLVGIWLTTIFIKVSLFLYTSVLCTAQLFSLKDYRPLTFSITMMIVGLSINITDNASTLGYFDQNVWPTFAYFVELIPAYYLLILWISRKKVAKPPLAAGTHAHPR